MKSKEEAPRREGESTKPVDSSLLTNDQLRPWTIDAMREEQLAQQMEDLEQTISFTSPQKGCGRRGDSELDVPLQNHSQFKQSLRDTLRTDPSFHETFERRFEPFTTAMRSRGVKFMTHAQRAALLCAEETEKKKKTTHRGESEKNSAVLAEVTQRRKSGSAVALSSADTLHSPRPELSRSPSLSSSLHAHSDTETAQTVQGKSLRGVEGSQIANRERESDADALLVERLQAQLRKEAQRMQSLTMRARPGTVPSVRYQGLKSPAILSMRKHEFEMLSSPSRTLIHTQPHSRSLKSSHYAASTESAAHAQSFSSPHHTAPHTFSTSLTQSLAQTFSSPSLSSPSTASFKYMQALKHHNRSPSPSRSQRDVDREDEPEKESFSSTKGRGFSSNDCALLVKPLSPVRIPTRASAKMTPFPQHK